MLTTPVVRCIKQQVPGAEVHYLTKRAFRQIIENNPYIDKGFYLDKDLPGLLSDLKKEKYDYVIDLHNNLRTWRVKRALATKSATFNKLNIRKWLLVNFRVNKLPGEHIVDRYMNAASLLHVKNDKKGLDFFIPESDRINRESLPENHRRGYVAFAIGAQHFTKRLPVKKIIAICSNIDKPVLLLGGRDDMENGYIIQNALGQKIYNACGLYNINQSASLVQQSEAVISHDTGLMHIAAALGKNIVSIWGNTIPEFGMSPYLKGKDAVSRIVEVQHLECRPCSKIGHQKCPKGHFNCMGMISEAEVTEALTAVCNSSSK